MCSKFHHTVPVALPVLLAAGNKTSECYISGPTKTMHGLQMVEEELSASSPVLWICVLGSVPDRMLEEQISSQ